MDPNKLPDHSGMTGVPWLGRGRGLQPGELAVGRSRGLLLSTEEPAVGRARGLPTTGDIPQGRGVTVPSIEPVLGRARGLLFSAAEPKVGVARGAILHGLEPQEKQIPACETTAQGLKTEESLSLTPKEVRARDGSMTL